MTAEPATVYRLRGPLTELTLARVRELTREPEAIFWVFIFPILLAAILGLAFRSRPPDALPVAVVDGPQADAARERAGGRIRSAAAASSPRPKRSRRLRAAASCSSCPRTTRPPTRTTRRSPRAALRASPSTRRFSAPRAAPTRLPPGRAEVTEPGSRYVDFLVPGPARHEPDGHGDVGDRLLAGRRAQRQPAQADRGRAGPPEPRAWLRS